MTREEKDLLLRDLCARLPYGVKIKTKADNESYTLLAMHPNKDIAVIGFQIDDIFVTSKIKIDAIKPYLRPLSSMTEEEMEEMHNELSPTGTAEYKYYGISTPITHIGDFIPYEYMSRVIDWLNKKMFDYRGLIEKGLAIEVTEDNNPYKD